MKEYDQLIEEVEGRLSSERYRLRLCFDAEYSEEVEFLEELKAALRRLQEMLPVTRDSYLGD